MYKQYAKPYGFESFWNQYSENSYPRAVPRAYLPSASPPYQWGFPRERAMITTAPLPRQSGDMTQLFDKRVDNSGSFLGSGQPASVIQSVDARPGCRRDIGAAKGQAPLSLLRNRPSCIIGSNFVITHLLTSLLQPTSRLQRSTFYFP